MNNSTKEHLTQQTTSHIYTFDANSDKQQKKNKNAKIIS